MTGKQTITFPLEGEHIALNDLLKVAGVCDSGGAGKALVAAGEVTVDGTQELRKTAKIRAGGGRHRPHPHPRRGRLRRGGVMPIAFWCVLLAGILPVLTVAVAKGGGKSYDNHDPRARLEQQSGRARADRPPQPLRGLPSSPPPC